MPQLSPKLASALADGVYDVQNPSLAKLFMMRPEFSEKSGQKSGLTAEVGFRLLYNAKDSFGLCAKGGGAYANDTFLIFRGSTTANNGADWMSNARIGLEFSKTE